MSAHLVHEFNFWCTQSTVFIFAMHIPWVKLFHWTTLWSFDLDPVTPDNHEVSQKHRACFVNALSVIVINSLFLQYWLCSNKLSFIQRHLSSAFLWFYCGKNHSILKSYCLTWRPFHLLTSIQAMVSGESINHRTSPSQLKEIEYLHSSVRATNRCLFCLWIYLKFSSQKITTFVAFTSFFFKLFKVSLDLLFVTYFNQMLH